MVANEKNHNNLSQGDDTNKSPGNEKEKKPEENTSLFSEFIQRSIQGSFDGDYYPIDEHYLRIRG
ncbi:MAG: hypothetical protein AB1333_04030 [Patescibacteria group bacterium]